MNTTNSVNPVYDGVWFKPRLVKPHTVTLTNGSANTNAIHPTAKVVVVEAVTTNTSDFIVLPNLADVPNCHEITILCNAGGAFKLTTPATSNEKINAQDSDGTKTYTCTDTEVVKVIKLNSITGWMAHAYTALGAVATAVVPG